MKVSEYASDPELHHVCREKKTPYWILDTLERMRAIGMVKDTDLALERVQEHAFVLQKIVFEAKVKSWTVHLNLLDNPDNIGSKYVCCLFWSPVNIEKEIKKHRDDIKAIENEPTLLPSEDKKRIKEIEQKIKQCEDRIARTSREMQPILFYAAVESVKYGIPASVSIHVTQTTAIQIAENVEDVGQYTLAIVEQSDLL